MRGLPNMKVIVAADYTEAKKAVAAMAETEGPVYMRTARSKTPVLFDDDYKLEFGKATELRKGKDIAILACGPMVSESLAAAEELEKKGVSVSVVNMSSIKPIDGKMILKKAGECRAIVTAEDHSMINGLGTAVQEVISDNCLCIPIEKVAVKDIFGESGKPRELYKKYGLDSEAIVKAVEKALTRCKK